MLFLGSRLVFHGSRLVFHGSMGKNWRKKIKKNERNGKRLKRIGENLKKTGEKVEKIGWWRNMTNKLTNKRYISIIYRSSLLSSSISSSSYLPPHSYWVLIVILNNNIDNFTPARRQLVWMFLAQPSCGRSPKEIEMGSKVPITPTCNNSDDITGHLRHFGHFSLTLLNVQCPMSNAMEGQIWSEPRSVDQ